MGKYLNGEYKPKNLWKYVGNKPPTYRSSWELKIFLFFDEHPSILLWGSEPFFIPYFCPVKNRMAKYFPDLICKYIDRDGKTYNKVIEIKPYSQTVLEAAKSRKDKLSIIINHAKWEAAKKFCEANNMIFEILTEKNIFKS